MPANDLSGGNLIGIVTINLAFHMLFTLLKTLPFADDDLSEAIENLNPHTGQEARLTFYNSRKGSALFKLAICLQIVRMWYYNGTSIIRNKPSLAKRMRSGDEESLAKSYRIAESGLRSNGIKIAE